jgi:hypothetical protein
MVCLIDSWVKPTRTEIMEGPLRLEFAGALCPVTSSKFDYARACGSLISDSAGIPRPLVSLLIISARSFIE